MPHRWGERGEHWKEWLRRSPGGVDLLVWWTDAGGDIRSLVGDARYRERLAELLSRASPRDCAALGLGCTRRIDRSCREPWTCALDPVGRPGAGPRPSRCGPVPGACDAFLDCWTEFGLTVRFTADDRHRAVHLRDRADSDRVSLWVDGVAVAEGAWLDESGRWVDERLYVVDAAGPEDHPEQDFTFGHLGHVILSVVVHDVERATTQVLVPAAGESWTDPVVRRDGDTWRLYPHRSAVDAGRPDRVLPVEPPPGPAGVAPAV
ncbi:hypothetical protein [Streptomyces sp. CB03911]|uniref:hypothetical protein n=1 Tax=Streptomycetaceae TaxID=2062 RepID=UPI00093DC09A|nr:hypothetical protein [Streptomyces sp. CB03911]OKI29250.1 hypothetical protein A6A07_24085 [Streptomyces sp. CB03911]